ncbi:MAG: 4Fe-4S binding protein [Ruminiclostridium sp.]|nr:4Fe-4S binding protein [Ruminiclostridium sp.]
MKLSAKDINETSTWQEMTLGGEIYEPATSKLTNTGAWRTNTPVLDVTKCRHCLMCVPYCPDSSLPVMYGRLVGIDYFHCKGCGICAEVCPFDAISTKEGGEV